MCTATHEQQQVHNTRGKTVFENVNSRQQLAGNGVAEKSNDPRYPTTPESETHAEVHHCPWQLNPS